MTNRYSKFMDTSQSQLLETLAESKNIFHLSVTLAKFRFKLRNAGSYLGIFWYLLEPLSFFAIIMLLQASVSRQGIAHYPLYVMLGLVMYNFFNANTTQATRIIRSNGGFVKSIKIPLESITFATALQVTFSHVFEFLIFTGLYFYIGGHWSILFYPVIFLFFALFAIGVSFILAVIGAYIEDLRNVWQIFTRLLWLGTPIFYTPTPGSKLEFLSQFNPIYHFLGITRDIVIYQLWPDAWYLISLATLSIAVCVGGLIIFNHYKPRFGELI